MKQTQVIAALLAAVLLGGCYYDNEEYLYPVSQNGTCDTAVVSFANALQPVIQQNCIACHSALVADGGVVLEGHAGVAANIDAVIGAIKHAPGFAPMPQGGNKLSDCTVLKFEVWRNRGAQNN